MDPETLKLLVQLAQSMERIQAQNAEYHSLVILAIVLCFAMLIKELFYLARFLRRIFGLTQQGGDPTDLLTLGQAERQIHKHDQSCEIRVGDVAKALTISLDAHFAAMLQELKEVRKKANTQLVLLRDIRAFMLYGQKPVGGQTQIIAIEEENGG